MAGSIIIPLITGFDSKGIKQAESALAGFGNKIKSFGRVAAAGLAVGGTAAAVSFVKDSASAAMELQRNMSGMKTIFGQVTPIMQDYVAQSEKMGMSHADAARAVTFLGSVFKQTGMPMQDVIDHTKTMVSLGADLASTYGYSVDEALTAMTATFRGEYDPIEKFGVAMKQQQVNAELAARGMKNLTGAALIAAQQQVRYEMILNRTKDAQGAFARQTGNMFEQQQILNAELKDMKATLGEMLMPSLIQMMETLKPLIDKLGPHLVGVFASLATVITALTPLLPRMADTLAKAFDLLGSTLVVATPALKAFLGFITDNLPAIVTFFAAFKAVKGIAALVKLFGELRAAMALYTGATVAATTATEGMAVAAAATPWGAIALSIGLVTAAIVALQEATSKVHVKGTATDPMYSDVPKWVKQKAIEAGNAVAKQMANQLSGQDMLEAVRAAREKVIAEYLDKNAWKAAFKIFMDNLPSVESINAHHGYTPSAADTTNTNTTTTVAKVKTWYQQLQDLVRQEAAKTKLIALGASAGLADSIVGSGEQWKAAFDKAIAQGKAGIAKLQALWNKTAAGKAELAGSSNAAKSAVDAFYAGLKDEIAKQAAMLKLSGMGYSQAFIDAVVGSGDQWQATFNDIVARGQAAVAQLQGMFNQTAAGIAEQNAAITAANQAAMDAYNAAMDAYNKRQDLRNSILSTLDAFRNLTAIAPEMGQFESAVVSALDGIKASLDAALKSGDLTTQAYNSLLSYAQKESAILQSIAKQRDALAQKISLAKAVISDVKAAIMGAGNLTSLVQGQSQTVTETYKKIIDGVEVTVSRTVDIVKSNDLVQAYRDVLAKTKTFASQLMQLKAMGLNSNLFKQIVDAGVDAGGATASAIIAGGADAVTSLNDVFAQLDTTGTAIAEQTAQVMYGAGVDVSNGLIAGLQAQDAALAATAQSLATTFTTTFQSMLNTFVPALPMPVMPTPTPLITGTTPPVAAFVGVPLDAAGLQAAITKMTTYGVAALTQNEKWNLGIPFASGGLVEGLGNGISDSISAQLSKGEFVMSAGAVNKYGKDKLGAMNNGTYEEGRGATYNITVNAGMGTDGGDVGRKIVNEIKRYERNNGAVWVKA